MCTVRSMAPSDPVNHPSHYTRTSLETIDVIEDMVKGWPSASAYRLGNVLKYIWRHRDKGDPKENLKKALWYLQRELDALAPPSMSLAEMVEHYSRPVEFAKPLEQRSVVVEPLPPEKHNNLSKPITLGDKVWHRNLPLIGVGEAMARGLDGLLDVKFQLGRRWAHEDDLELA